MVARTTSFISAMRTPSGVSGVVSFGLPPEAMGLFPQIEVNLDSYPKSYGMHIHFITNATGGHSDRRSFWAIVMSVGQEVDQHLADPVGLDIDLGQPIFDLRLEALLL